MTYYCTTSDVSQRLGLNSAQRTQAESRITSAIRRATIDIDMTFRDYGRDTPSREVASTTLNGAISAGATSIILTDASSFSTAGNGDIDGDSFAWTSKSSNTLNGVTGVSADHASGVTVQEGEFAAVLREICADLSAAYYFEDEALFQSTTSEGSLRSTALRERGSHNLQRVAHLGTVD